MVVGICVQVGYNIIKRKSNLMRKMVYDINEIKRTLKNVFKQTPVRKAVLFGSYAKGTANAKSDIDLYIDSHGKLSGFNFFGVCADIEKAFSKKIDLIEKIDLEQKSKLASEIKRTGITVYER